MPRKSAHEIVSEAYKELEKLAPTDQEIQEYADLKEKKEIARTDLRLEGQEKT